MFLLNDFIIPLLIVLILILTVEFIPSFELCVRYTLNTKCFTEAANSALVKRQHFVTALSKCPDLDTT